MDQPLSLAALDELIDAVDTQSYPKYLLATPADMRSLQREKGRPEFPSKEGEGDKTYHMYRIERNGVTDEGPV